MAWNLRTDADISHPMGGYRLLPKDELLEVLRTGSAAYLLGATDYGENVRVIWSDFREQSIPKEWFKSPTTEPDFRDPEVIDSGLTLKLGDFEADGLALPFYRQPMQGLADHGEAYARSMNYQLGDSLDGFLSRIGGDVQYYSVQADPPLLTTSGKAFVIGTHQYLNLERSRYEMAIALGHYVLHSKNGDNPLTIYPNRNFPVLAKEARAFARGLLIGKEDLLKYYDQYKGSLAALGARYMLQPEVVQQRLRDLGIP